MFSKFGFSGTSDFFEKAGRTIGRAIYLISASLGTVLLGFGGAFAGKFDFLKEWTSAQTFTEQASAVVFNPISTMVFGALFLFFGAIGAYRDQTAQNNEIDELRKTNSELDTVKDALNAAQEDLQDSRSKLVDLHGELVQNWLKNAVKSLNIDSNSRVTIYIEYDEEFYLLQRYSKNPTYAKVHRQKFPLNQGVISKAWEHQSHIEDMCPNSSEYKAYETYLCEVYGYETSKIQALTMKSSRYFANAVEDADVHTGVIVFESTEQDFFDKCCIEDLKKFCSDNNSLLAKIIRESVSYNKEINLIQKRTGQSVENEILAMMEVEK